jgi:lipid A 3-O-deacylase
MIKNILWFLCALLFSGNAFSVDGVFVEGGNGKQTDAARAGATFKIERQWFTEGDWHVVGHWEASVGTWRGHSGVGSNKTVTDLGVTPVFRLQEKSPGSVAPYVEGAVGFHLISPTTVYADRRLGSAFQFGDHIGFGVLFGEHKQFELGYRFQHISNGGIKQPNQGLNLNLLRFVYHF